MAAAAGGDGGGGGAVAAAAGGDGGGGGGGRGGQTAGFCVPALLASSDPCRTGTGTTGFCVGLIIEVALIGLTLGNEGVCV